LEAKSHENVEEPEPELTHKTTTVSKLSEALKFSEARIRLFEDIDSNEQRTTSYRIEDACCFEYIQKKKKKKEKKKKIEKKKKKKKSSSHQSSVLDFFRKSAVTRSSLPVLLDVGNDKSDQPAVQEELSPS
jgi:hypothetical protein